MNIILKSTKDVTYPNAGRYVIAWMECGKQEATVTIACGGPGLNPYVNVVVHNASNRAWKGMGKVFQSVPEAIANYKSASIRSMIEAAGNLAA